MYYFFHKNKIIYKNKRKPNWRNCSRIGRILMVIYGKEEKKKCVCGQFSGRNGRNLRMCWQSHFLFQLITKEVKE